MVREGTLQRMLLVLRVFREFTSVHARVKVQWIEFSRFGLSVKKKTLVSLRRWSDRFRKDIERLYSKAVEYGVVDRSIDVTELINKLYFYFTPTPVFFWAFFVFSFVFAYYATMVENVIVKIAGIVFLSIAIFGIPVFGIQHFYLFTFNPEDTSVVWVARGKLWWKWIVPWKVYHIVQGISCAKLDGNTKPIEIDEKDVELIADKLRPVIIVSDRIVRESELMRIEVERLRKAVEEMERQASKHFKALERVKKSMLEHKESSDMLTATLIALLVAFLLLLLLHFMQIT